MSRRQIAVLAGAALLAAWMIGQGAADLLPGTPRVPSSPVVAHAPSGRIASATDAVSGLPTVALKALPPEARATIDRIAAGGPYPFDQDGAVYQNRERNLPARPAGAYREYTVVTPGSPDRGARRIVAGDRGELYWTADHYASFARIVP
jgi:ribonuclease T1